MACAQSQERRGEGRKVRRGGGKGMEGRGGMERGSRGEGREYMREKKGEERR